MKNKIFGTSILSFIAAIAGIIISFLLLKEDVFSTAKTIFEYFPIRYGVTPAASWQGAQILGIFVSIVQIVSASVTFSNRFPIWLRIVASMSLASSLYFDNWTDVVFRSGYLTGNKMVATISTLSFYTIGSEITQTLAWAIVFSTWRAAISDLMWGWARFVAGLSTIGTEWIRFKNAARNKESGYQQSTWNGFPKESLMNKDSGSHKVVSPVFGPKYDKKGK